MLYKYCAVLKSTVRYLDSTDSVAWYLQEVGEELGGECEDFEAVPGHGLKCVVSGMEGYARKKEWRYSKLFQRDVCVHTSLNMMVRDIEMGAGSRKYQVSTLSLSASNS